MKKGVETDSTVGILPDANVIVGAFQKDTERLSFLSLEDKLIPR